MQYVKHITPTTVACSGLQTDLLVVIHTGETLNCQIDDERINKQVMDVIEKINGKSYTQPFFTALNEDASAKFLLVLSTSFIKYYEGGEGIKIAASSILGYAKGYDCAKAAVLINGENGEQQATAVTEGLLLGGYSFDKYLKEKKDKTVEVELVVDSAAEKSVADAIERASVIAAAANQARDLVNEPAEVIIPEKMAQMAQDMAKEVGLDCEILDEKQLAEGDYNCILAVGQGSEHPPRMIILRYEPENPSSDKHLALVGKGITFDTGGISMKTPANLWLMKSDMGGSAAVFGAMRAIGQLKPNFKVTGIIASAENAVDGTSQNPGNILIAKNGKSIHVDNTDAEGRLVLTDAFARAGEENATHMIDAATLTGGCVVALGWGTAGVMGDAKLAASIKQAGEQVGEKFWHLPLPEEYYEDLKISVADINNSGGRQGSALKAGLFLKAFVPESLTWAHLDIAGTAFSTTKRKYYLADGATGFGVRTFVELATHPELFDE